MRPLAIKIAALLVTISATSSAFAGRKYSEYTKLNLDKDCTFVEIYEQGGSADCKGGFAGTAIYFSEGDLRHQVRYGTIDGSYDQWETFSEFNQINETIEWRIENGKPFATILRWFINNEDPHAGYITEESRGNVLVISTIGTRQNPRSCIAGYVDARANKNANFLARDVADAVAKGFQCGKDKPKFHGNKGQWSGSPTVLAR